MKYYKLAYSSLCLAIIFFGWLRPAMGVMLDGYLPPVRLNGEFTLTDQNGQNFSSDQLRGKHTLLMFGYTHCTDICPTALRDALQIKKLLGDQIPVQVVFITLDPERDTPAVLAKYASAYDPEIVALTGDLPTINKVAQRYRMKFRKKLSKRRPGDYAIDHSAFLYLLDKKTSPLVFYLYGTALNDIVSDVKLLEQHGQGLVSGRMINKAGMMDH